MENLKLLKIRKKKKKSLLKCIPCLVSPSLVILLHLLVLAQLM